MLKRVLNTELEKKVFEDEMMEKLSVVPAEYEVYEEYASRQENFDKDFFTYCNKTPLLVDADEASYDESEENVGVPNCKEKSLETFMAEVYYRYFFRSSKVFLYRNKTGWYKSYFGVSRV